MARMVATKAALSIRVDALTDSDGKSQSGASSIGIENRAKLESRLRALEHTGDLHGAARFSGGGRKQERFQMAGSTKTYNTQADFVTTQREDPMEQAMKVVQDVKEEKRRAKEERRAKRRAEKEKEMGVEDVEDVEDVMEIDGQDDGQEKVVDKKDKKDKKRKRRESEINGAAVVVPDGKAAGDDQPHKKDKKRKQRESEVNGGSVAAAAPEVKVGFLLLTFPRFASQFVLTNNVFSLGD
jgi:nucleolar protein 58